MVVHPPAVITTGRGGKMKAATSEKIASFWRGVVDPDRVDKAIELYQELIASYRTDEPGTEIYAVHLEAPNTIWLYALFNNQEALDAHLRGNEADTRVQAFRQLLSEYEMAHETTPLVAKGIATGA
jgi:quinol monooxygenase YgiN